MLSAVENAGLPEVPSVAVRAIEIARMAFSSELRKIIKEEISLALKSTEKSSQEESGTLSFDEFYKAREDSRQSGFQPKAKKKKSVQTPRSSVEVEVKVCLAYHKDGKTKARRGKVQIIKVSSEAGRDDFLKKSVEKHAQFDQTFDDSVTYSLLYPDFSPVGLIPGTKEEFTLQGYKQACGKEFKRLTFYLLPADDDPDAGSSSLCSDDDDTDTGRNDRSRKGKSSVTIGKSNYNLI